MLMISQRLLATSRANTRGTYFRRRWAISSQIAFSFSNAAPTESSSNNMKNNDQSTTSSIEDQRQKLSRAALKHVPQHGWTQEAITAAVVEGKMNISLSGLLTPTELVNFIMDDFNQNLQGNTVYEKIEWRLRQIIPFVESGQWQDGMAIGLLQTPRTTRDQLHEFIELVAPSGSTTMYKTGLGGIFVATELHMLSDNSPDYQETWTFLQNRLDELDRGDYTNIVVGDSIPLAATGAVASSLLEGVASLVLPSSSSPIPGTRTSDYEPNKK